MCIALFLLNSACFAQSTSAGNIPLFTTPPLVEVTASILWQDPDNGYRCIALKTKKDQLIFLLLDESFHLIGKIETSWFGSGDLFLADMAIPLGSPFYSNGVFHAYFTLNPRWNSERLFEETIDFRTHNVTEKQQVGLSGSQAILGFLLDNQHQPCLIADSTTAPSLALYKEDTSGNLIRQDMPMPWLQKPADHFGFIRFVDENKPQELDEVTGHSLAYVRGQQLVLFHHHPDSALQLTVTDLQTMQTHVKTEPVTGTYPDTVHYSVCSAVMDDKIFRLRSFEDHFELVIYQIPSMDTLKCFTWDMYHTPLFTLEPVHYGHSLLSKESTDAYGLQGLIADLYHGPDGIAVNKTDSGDYQITLGYYTKGRNLYSSYDHPDFCLIADANIRIPDSWNNDAQNLVSPAAQSFGAGGVVLNALTNKNPGGQDPGEYRFEATLAKITLQHASLENILSRNFPWGNARLSDLLHDHKDQTAVHTFRFKAKWYEAYYDKKTHTYRIEGLSL
jgi:hypothetical protein